MSLPELSESKTQSEFATTDASQQQLNTSNEDMPVQPHPQDSPDLKQSSLTGWSGSKEKDLHLRKGHTRARLACSWFSLN
ncbi:hypothetical protein RRG08_028598 [Elysia crispata]|uniref:Uncharacterized protein n=1 Tax=Elysia crispata TaxID=231223 RepID=A0AAE0ZU19_9GAST|nr:hypothetical protein RRG08_028598 [Elysia crispata]